MNAPVSAARPQPPCLAILGDRGNVILYNRGENNRCPSCGQTQWYVGRQVATCARCDAHVPIATPNPPNPAILEEAA